MNDLLFPFEESERGLRHRPQEQPAGYRTRIKNSPGALAKSAGTPDLGHEFPCTFLSSLCGIHQAGESLPERTALGQT